MYITHTHFCITHTHTHTSVSHTHTHTSVSHTAQTNNYICLEFCITHTEFTSNQLLSEGPDVPPLPVGANPRLPDKTDFTSRKAFTFVCAPQAHCQDCQQMALDISIGLLPDSHLSVHCSDQTLSKASFLACIIPNPVGCVVNVKLS